jgi:2,4-diaminopentanoate dehydrogenase
VQWATGNIGMRSLRGVIEHPSLELVGVLVYAPEKAGADAGELCGVGPCGVTATDDVDEIVALEADCVLYMPRSGSVEEICRLLGSGTNVVTTTGEFHRPDGLDAGLRAAVESACRSGGVSVHSTGSSPGFITEAVPLVLTSIQRRLDRLVIDEYADLSQRNSPELLFDLMGFGRPPAAMTEGRDEYLKSSFGPSLELVADALSIPLDTVEAAGEVATALASTTVAAGTLEAGTVAGQRTTVSGTRSGRPVLQFRATWYCTPDLDPAWDVRPTGWHLSVEGDAPLDVDLRFAVPLERMAAMSPGYTANRAVNVAPLVCAAPPGIVSSVDLPQIVADLGSDATRVTPLL